MMEIFLGMRVGLLRICLVQAVSVSLSRRQISIRITHVIRDVSILLRTKRPTLPGTANLFRARYLVVSPHAGL